MKQLAQKNIKRSLCSLAVGGVNSLFGGGGGMIAVPLLAATGLEEKRAHATALFIVLPVSACSFLFYLFRGVYDFSVLIPTAIGVTAGGVLGAKLLQKMPLKIVKIVFAALQLFAGVWMFFVR